MAIKKIKVGIVGYGQVGSSLYHALKLHGHRVLTFDVDERKKSEDSVDTFDEVCIKSNFIIECVPTPNDKTGKCDLTILTQVVKKFAYILKRNRIGRRVFVQMSTVIPGTADKMVELIQSYGLTNDKDFNYAVLPSFLNMGKREWCMKNPYKWIVGSNEESTFSYIKKLLDGYINVPIIELQRIEAEFAKYALNLYSSLMISFWNELYLIGQKFGVNTNNIAEVIEWRNLGKIGRIHGKAFGGECLPKDLSAFISWVKDNGCETKIMEMVEQTNKTMMEKFGVREKHWYDIFP